MPSTVTRLWPSTAPQGTSDEDLVARSSQGDDRALTALLDRYRPYVRSRARTYFLVGGEREDIVQEGMIGLYKAVRDYDPERQPSFRNFAELCITRQIISAIKSATRHKHTPLNRYVSLHGRIAGDDDADHAPLSDAVASPNEDPADMVVSSAQLASLREHCAEVLSELETEVLRRYVDGESYQEIAAELGRHVKAVDNAIQRIKRKLDQYLTSELGAAV